MLRPYDNTMVLVKPRINIMKKIVIDHSSQKELLRESSGKCELKMEISNNVV